MLNRAPEPEPLPYCQQHGIAVMVRGPLAQGLLSGHYNSGLGLHRFGAGSLECGR